MLTLYATPLSANGRKVLAVARHLGVDARVELVNVYAGEGRAPAFLAINPSGKIPVLVEEGFVLTESNAILQYLAETHGGDLWPRDARGRADVARWMYWEASQWQPALAAILAPFVGRLIVPQLASTPAVDVAWGDPAFVALARHLDAHLASRPFLAGGALTVADFSVAGMMTYARAAKLPFDALANVGAWYARIEALDAWKGTLVAPWS